MGVLFIWNKKHLLFLLVVCLVGAMAISSVSANDFNESMILEENTSPLEGGDLVCFNEDNSEGLSFDDEKLSINEDSDILSTNFTPKTSSEIQSCVDGANDGDTIILDGYYLISGTINVNKSLNFVGINDATIDGNSKVRLFSVSNSAIIFNNITFKNGFTDKSGGAIYGSTFFSVINCSFVNNSAKNGGAIYKEYSPYGTHCNALNCTFINNSAIYWGGAMFFSDAVNCTFINNSAEQGGAIYYGSAVKCSFANNSASSCGGALFKCDAVGCLFVNNSNSYSSPQYSDFGGGAMNRGSARNCTFIENTCNSYGGASSYTDCVDCLFICNSGSYGGAMNMGSAKNCTFISNVANSGGALRDSSAINCTFINNSECAMKFVEKNGNAIDCIFINNTNGIIDHTYYYLSNAINCTFINTLTCGVTSINAINCTFINNTKGFSGAGSLSAINCKFINNSGSAMSGGSAVNSSFINNAGGAIYHVYDVLNCIFINNSANDGGAINGAETIENCIFINNSALNEGGAIVGNYYYGSTYSEEYHNCLIKNCTFFNNFADKGGAVSGTTNIVHCTFIGNNATYGGSINGIYKIYIIDYYDGSYHGHYVDYYSNIDNCTFINCSAGYGGAMYDGNAMNCSFINNSADYGGAIYLENKMNISSCDFYKCYANVKGGAIYWNQSANIIQCSFSDCTSGEESSCLSFNSSQGDYLVEDCIFDEYPNNVDYHYVSTLIAGNLTYFNGELGILMANLSEIRGVLSGKIIFIDINGRRYNSTTDFEGMVYFSIENYLNKSGVYNATLTYEGDNIINPSSANVTITINKHDSILNVPELVLYKNEYGILMGNLNNIRGPLANKTIIFTLDGVNYRRTTNQNGVVEFNVLNYLDGRGKFDLNVTFEGDDFNNPSSTNVSVYIIDFRGILTCNVDGKYFNDTILVFSLINYKNNKPIFGAPIKLIFSNREIVSLTTDVDGLASYRMPFKPGTYDVTAYVDQEYVVVNNVSITDIEINKIFGEISHELLNGNKTLMFKLYNPQTLDVFRNVKIDLAFNNSETAEIFTDDNGMAFYDIPFPKGTYSVYVRVDGEYKQFEEDYISDIVITNDLNCSINFTNNITFAFGGYGSTNYVVDGGTVELDYIKVIDHPEALISITNSTITVFGLSVGKYVMEVEVIPDDYHNAVIGRINITVTNAPSKVTFNTGVVFEYGGSSSIHVIVEGGKVERKNIKVIGHPEANIVLNGQIITLSGLAVGNYDLEVTSTPDSDHTASTATVRVTVKKATAVIKASKITVAYKKGGQWTIKFIDSKSKKPIANMKVTLKVYTGKKFKTVSLKTNSKGEATYQTKKLAKGNHKVIVTATDDRYNFNSYSSSIKVVKQTALKFKVKKKTGKDGASLSITVMNKKTKKGVKGVKIKLLIYTGKKCKTVTLKSMKKGKFVGVCGYGTNKLSIGTHKVKIMPADIKYGGSATSTMKITKKAKKVPAWETKDSAK